jgi:hypothetical protein
MKREHRRERETLIEEELAGTRPALLFAAMLTGLTGGIAVLVFVVGLKLVDAFVVMEPGPSGLLTGAAVWLAFWVGLSAGLIGGLTLGYRAWQRVAPPFVRRAAEAGAREERAAAVRAAEDLLEERASRRDG